jgi:glycosyltransferase involved in cell wall biosynthesis
MEIIIITPINPYFSNSAAANRLISLVERLINNNVKITFLFVDGYNSNSERDELGSTGIYKNCAYTYLSESVLNNIWKRRWKKYVAGIYTSFITKLKLKKLLIGFNGIVWISNETKILKSVFSINQRKFNTFMEISEFLDIHQFNKGNKIQRLLADKRKMFFEEIVLKQLDGLALMTQTLIKHYLTFSNIHPKLLHLPMTVDLDRFNQIESVLDKFEIPYIAFIGVMDNTKDGVNILIQAFAKISTKFPNHKLYLIGGWNYDTRAHLKMIKNLNLEDKIQWLGEISREKIPAIVKNADLLVLPRPNSKQAQGGFPTKLGEYLASGVPVCATTVGEIPNYLIDNESVFFAEPGSIDSFVNAMDRALSDQEFAQKVGISGRNVAEIHFNKDIQSQKLYEFLKKL